MSLEGRNLVTAKEFGPELADQRVGWSAVTGYGSRRPDKIFSVNLVTATVGEEGASLEYEPREKDGEEHKAYWSDAAKGFIASAGVSVIIDTEENRDEAPRIGPYWSFEDDVIRGSSSGRILRVAGDSHNDEDELDRIKIWAENPSEIIANTRKIMADAGLSDYYSAWYYTANLVLSHESLRSSTPLWGVPAEATVLPDANMQKSTQAEIVTASSIVDNLTAADQIDETMMRSLTVFGDVPAEEIPAAFQASREKIFDIENQVREIEKRLNTQIGVYLPVGCTRTWPYISADIEPTDERAFGMELHRLKEGNPGLAQSELKDERSELEYRKNHAARGVTALQLLARAETNLAQDG